LRLRVSPDGVIHGLYSDAGLHYGSTATGPWLFEEVRRSGVFAERSPVMVFEGAETPSVAFTDYDARSVVLARKVDGTWDYEPVASSAEEPLGVAREPDGTLHAVFRRDEEGSEQWIHAIREGGTWSEAPAVAVTRTGTRSGSVHDVVLLDGQPVWADATGGLRLILGADDGPYRTFVADLDAETVRLAVAGTRLLVLATDGDFDVHFLELSLGDSDGDGVRDGFDVCPDVADPDQTDSDGDGIGDACNEAGDRDGDEVADVLDNCPSVANPDQANADRTEDLAVLDLATDRVYEVAPGATVTFDDSDGIELVAGGAELACGPCASADFSEGLTGFDLESFFCGRWLRDHLGRSSFCVREPASDLRVDLELRSVRDPDDGCIDGDLGASCEAAGGDTSAFFRASDGVGDLCDCDSDDGRCTAWADGMGFCDGSSPERSDDDCDYCSSGPDADGDGVSDTCDACPDDADKTEPGACGCGNPETEGCEPPVEPSEPPSGCGCQSPGLATATGWLGGLLLMALRRRTRR